MNLIYYFSGTGNSFWAAKKIKELVPNSKLISIVRALEQPEIHIEAEKVGLVFPIYFLGLPMVVKQFIQKAVWSETEYLYAVATKGWPVVGAAWKHLKQQFSTKDTHVSAVFPLQMVMNDVITAGIPSEEKWQQQLLKVPGKVEAIAQKIKNNKPSRPLEITAPLLKTRTRHYEDLCKNANALFTLDEGLCTGCGLCKKSCAFANIEIVDKVPVRGNSCILCEACYNVCPKNAIKVGKPQFNDRTYWHPDISVKELEQQKGEI
jgi:ferredoxin